MSSGIENWGLKDWLEASAYAVAIVGAIAGALIFTLNSRKASIENTRKEIARTWTNEGDISSNEAKFVTLTLQDHDGDLIGSLESPQLDHPLEVHAVVGWRSTDLVISDLREKGPVHVTTVKVRIMGNNNRLQWRLAESTHPEALPTATTLWPLNPPLRE